MPSSEAVPMVAVHLLVRAPRILSSALSFGFNCPLIQQPQRERDYTPAKSDTQRFSHIEAKEHLFTSFRARGTQ
jgi:hypothetical protein